MKHLLLILFLVLAAISAVHQPVRAAEQVRLESGAEIISSHMLPIHLAKKLTEPPLNSGFQLQLARVVFNGCKAYHADVETELVFLPKQTIINLLPVYDPKVIHFRQLLN